MQALGGKMISLKEWFDITEDEVSGSMVIDILCDWQKDRNELIRQIKNLTNKSSGRNSPRRSPLALDVPTNDGGLGGKL
ncbi:MAG: hypothetical protein KKE59_07625 [Proteobacteria bacterium]|nr:hypothetical protein [Pseudomonadota bacterium]